MEYITQTSITDLPQKALKTVFRFVDQNDRQRIRIICTNWNRIINEDFPVELIITNTNFERLFKCCNAYKVTIHGLITEFHGLVGFNGTVKTLIISGKVLSSNIKRILSSCHELETLVINSPKEVLGIENHEAFGLPKLTTLEFRVRMDQETFTIDEMILLNTLGVMKLGSLEKVLISVKLDWDEEDMEFEERSDIFSEGASGRFLPSLSTVSATNTDDRSRFPAVYPSLDLQSSNGTFTDVVPSDDGNNDQITPPQESDTDVDIDALISIAPEPSEVETMGPERRVQVDVSVGMTNASSRETTYSRVGVAEFEFASRLFTNHMQLWSRNSNADLESFLNGPITRGPRYGFGYPGNQMTPITNLSNVEIKTTAFFDLLKNNADNLKSFVVKARPDFVSFGNISSYSKEAIEKIQFEDLEYSFGRSKRLCSEHILLQHQGHLQSLKMHILDDLWNSVTLAVAKSQATLTELDVWILSLSEDPIDLVALSSCKNLKVLKLFHFFEKKHLHLLPSSLEKLVINGPVTKDDISSIATRLDNLTQFDLILNYQPSEKIDLSLGKRLIAMPKIRKLVFIQTQIDVDAICDLCQSTPGVSLSIQGPRELKEPYTLTVSIQYICISVNTDLSINNT